MSHKRRKPLYDFELGIDREPTDDEWDTLFELGCDDMLFGGADLEGWYHVAVGRRAPSFLEAAMTSIQQIESVGGLKVCLIVVDPELTIGDIAEKAKRSRETVRRATLEPDFPAPVNGTPRHRFWRWSEVATRFGVTDPVLEESAPVARILNAWLTLRNALPAVAPAMERVREALEAA